MAGHIDPDAAMGFKEIAERLGISEQRTHQIFQNAVRKLRVEFEKPERRELVAAIRSRRTAAGYGLGFRELMMEAGRCSTD